MVLVSELRKLTLAATFVVLGLLLTVQGSYLVSAALADEGDTTGGESGGNPPETNTSTPDDGPEGEPIVPPAPSDGQDTQQTTGGKPG